MFDYKLAILATLIAVTYCTYLSSFLKSDLQQLTVTRVKLPPIQVSMLFHQTFNINNYESKWKGTEIIEKLLNEEGHENLDGGGRIQSSTDKLKKDDLLKSDTPETYLTELTSKPDITLFCDKCQIFIDIRLFKHHRAYHSALQLLQFSPGTLPETSELLLKKRNALLLNLKKQTSESNPLQLKQIQQVNDAYELLKVAIEETFESCRQVKETVDIGCRATTLSCSPECVYALGTCSSANSRWRCEMEDTKTYLDSFGENRNKCYLGLFDGYHGRFSAEVAASLLHKMFLHEMMKFDDFLKVGPKQDYVMDTDISHHRFIFGQNAAFDGQDAREKSFASPKINLVNRVLGDVPVSIQPDNEELTHSIIQLCEHKFEKLLEDTSVPNTPTSAAKEGRLKHPLESKIAQTFKKSYHMLDILLSYGKDEFSKVRWSGCSALTVLIESRLQKETVENPGVNDLDDGSDDKTGDNTREASPPKTVGYIHLANAGDTRALLMRGNRVYRLSRDHTPNNPKERERIIHQGGTLSTSTVDCRVNGVLATTRGLGNHGDPKLKECVVVEPHTLSVKIDQYAQFLFMGTSGVWEVFSDQDIANLLMGMLPRNQILASSKPSSSVAHLLEPNKDVSSQVPGSDKSKKIVVSNAIVENAEESVDADKNSTVPIEDVGGLKIPVDLKTEIGSIFDDTEGSDHVLHNDPDVVVLPVHSQLQLGSTGSVEEQRRELAGAMAERVTQAALLAGCHNNITVMVVLFPGCGI